MPGAERIAEAGRACVGRSTTIEPGLWLTAAANLARLERLIDTNRRYYERRAAEEKRAIQRAVTPEARERHEELLQIYERKVRECALD